MAACPVRINTAQRRVLYFFLYNNAAWRLACMVSTVYRNDVMYVSHIPRTHLACSSCYHAIHILCCSGPNCSPATRAQAFVWATQPLPNCAVMGCCRLQQLQHLLRAPDIFWQGRPLLLHIKQAVGVDRQWHARVARADERTRLPHGRAVGGRRLASLRSNNHCQS